MRKDAEDNIRIIKDLVVREGPQSQTEICKKTGIKEDTVRAHGNYLIKQGIFVRDGKFGKYRLASNINLDLVNFDSRNRGFRYRALNNIFKWKVNHKSPNKFTKFEFSDKDLFGNDNDNDNEDLFNEIVLYEFSNKIAAYILYIMINAIEPDKYTLIVNGFKNRDVKMKENDKNMLIEKWLTDTIDIKLIFKQFCKLGFVHRGLKQRFLKLESLDTIQNRIRKAMIDSLSESDKKRFKQDIDFTNFINRKTYQQAKEEYDYYHEKYSKRPKELSDYEMDQVNHIALVNTFRNIFPDIFVELEKKKENLKSKSIKDYYQKPEPKLTEEEIEEIDNKIYDKATIGYLDSLDRQKRQ